MNRFKIPLKHRLIFMSVAVIPVMIFGFLTNSLLGLLILSVAFYLLSPTLLGVEPSFAPLVSLVFANPEASLAISGLIFAYFTTLVVWRRQKWIELRLLGASEAREFFSEAQHHATILDSFAQALIETKTVADSGQLADERWRLFLLQSNIQEAAEARQALRASGRKVHGIHQKYAHFFDSSFIASQGFPKAVKALSDLAILGQYYIPEITEDVARMEAVFRRCDPESWNAYVKENFALTQKMMMWVNSINAMFHAQLATPNLAQIASLIRHIRDIWSIPEADLRPK